MASGRDYSPCLVRFCKWKIKFNLKLKFNCKLAVKNTLNWTRNTPIYFLYALHAYFLSLSLCLLIYYLVFINSFVCLISCLINIYSFIYSFVDLLIVYDVLGTKCRGVNSSVQFFGDHGSPTIEMSLFSELDSTRV